MYYDDEYYEDEEEMTSQEKFVRSCFTHSSEEIEWFIDNGYDLEEAVNMYGADYTPLIAAVAGGNLEAVKILLDRGAEPFPAYMISLNADDKIMVKYLTKRIGINTKDERGRTPLFYAATINNLKMVRFLIKLGADVNAIVSKEGEEGETALTYLSMLFNDGLLKISQGIVKALIAAGADYDRAMVLAIKENNLKLMDLLLKAGADINKPCLANQTPLSAAILHSNSGPEILKMIKLLIKRGADIDQKIFFDEGAFSNVLNLAISMDRPDIVKILLNAGADPNFLDYSGKSSIMFSILTSNKILRLLLSNGGNPNLKDNNGRTPLMLAAIDGDSEDGVIKSLLEFGADPNIQDEKGYTALMWTINGQDRIPDFSISALIRTGAIRAKGVRLWLALSIFYAFSRRETQLQIVKFLINNGADLNIRDHKGMTALSHALMNFDNEIAEILKENLKKEN